MKIVLIIGIVLVLFFVFTLVVYWFNLDTKIVKLLEKPMMKLYDNKKRDRKI